MNTEKKYNLMNHSSDIKIALNDHNRNKSKMGHILPCNNGEYFLPFATSFIKNLACYENSKNSTFHRLWSYRDEKVQYKRLVYDGVLYEN